MSEYSLPLAATQPARAQKLFIAGAVAGVLDAAFAAALYVGVLKAMSVLTVLQYIASGLLGKSAFSGGLATAALGAAIHFVIAWAWAAIYLAALDGPPRLRTRLPTPSAVVAAGLLFGAAIWLIMDLLVLPLSGAAPTPASSPLFAAFLVEHALLVGLPIAWLSR